jgi:hypothetical protein
MQVGVDANQTGSSNQVKFSDVIRREPEYQSSQPFRGVATLGTQNFGFALDSNTPDKRTTEKKSRSSKPIHYQRLHFDLNGNGDLTDDEVIKAETRPGIRFPSSYASYTFPRVDLTIDAGGTKIDYAFRFSAYSNASGTYQYVSASLNSAAYREGYITLDGKKRRMIIVDYNSNGRFDDRSEISDTRTSDGSVYVMPGDMIYVDFDPNQTAYSYGYDPTTSDSQQYVAKLLAVDDRYYEMKVTPAGDQLELTPSKTEIGYVTNPNLGYRAVIYGDGGFVKIRGDESGKAAVPVGKWKLASYTIDRTGFKEKPEEESSEPSLLEALSNAFLSGGTSSGSSSGFTMVSARGTQDYPEIEVRKDETASLPFGPPFKPVVTVSYRQGTNKVALEMSLKGASGEACSNLMVNGRRPPDPHFTIKAPDGTEVESGKFEYG